MDILSQLSEQYGLNEADSGQEVRALAIGWSVIDHLAAARTAAGLTQAEVADRMGTTQAAVAKLETHRHDPRLSTLMRYVAALSEQAEPFLQTLDAYLDGSVAVRDLNFVPEAQSPTAITWSAD